MLHVKAYQYKNRYFCVWFRDDGWMLAILPLSHVCGGLLKAEFPTDRTLTIIKSARKEWREIPYEPCMIVMPQRNEKELFLDWGFYHKEELSSRTEKKVIPLDSLGDFISDFLASHEDYWVLIYYTCMIHGGATHHLSITRWLGDCEFEGILQVMREFIAEVLW